MQATYSAWLLVVWKLNRTHCLTTMPVLLFKIILVHPPFLSLNLSTWIVHVMFGLRYSSSINSRRKSVSTWALISYQGSYQMSCFERSIAQWITWLARPSLCKTCWIRRSVLMTIMWDRKYCLSPGAVVRRRKTTFSSFWFRVSALCKAFLTK